MKTISSTSEYDDVLSSSDSVVTCVQFKSAYDPLNQNIALDCPSQSAQGYSQNIKCNSCLASAFKTVKSDVTKIRPGHYLQKVFFTYGTSHKSKSQSLPCVDNESSNEPREDFHASLSENSDLCDSNIHENCSSKDKNLSLINSSSTSSNNNLWYKTWPERCSSIDKKHFLQSEDSEVGFQELPNSQWCIEDDKFEVTSIDYEHCQSKSLDPTKKNESVLNSPTNVNSSNSPVHLNSVLESIPLGYSPLTKQLFIIKPSKIESHKGEAKNYSDDENSGEVVYENINSGSICISKEELKSSKIVTDSNYSSSLQNDNNLVNELPRVATVTSCCSYSSTLSSLSDVSPSTNNDSAVGSLLALDHGDSCSLVSIGGCSILSEDSASIGTTGVTTPHLKQKKKSFSDFFSRNVFGWKHSNGEDKNLSQTNHLSTNSSSWKLFSRTNSGAPHSTLSHSGLSGYESGGGSTTPGSPCSVKSTNSVGCKSTSSRVRSHENIIASSTALIQLDRPSCLPAKSPKELEKHRQQYQDILDAAKKKELKEAKQQKRQLQLQLRIEEQQAQAARTWSHEILPKWETMCHSRKTRDLWWMGIPPCVRGKVWRLAIKNELNLDCQLFDKCCERARNMLKIVDDNSSSESDNKEASVQLIQLDISRTFPNLCIFQKGGPYYDMLHCLLGAYVCYRPDIGYVQGMSFIAAVLILNMDVSDAFICFANLLNRPCLMAFFSLNQPLMQAYYATYNDLLTENLPHVFKHFVTSNLSPDLYLLDWIYTVFTKAMNLDLACRVWDLFLRDGEEFLFRTALGVLHLCQDFLLKMDFVHGSQYLTRLPEDLPPNDLFKSINQIKMNVGQQSFEQILSIHVQEQENLNSHQ